MYQERHGDWLPYFGIAHAELEFKETHEALVSEIFPNRPGGTIVTKDDGLVLIGGVDYPLTNRLHLRADLTIFNSDYLETHDVIRIGTVFHF